jgi:hypothetical protein
MIYLMFCNKPEVTTLQKANSFNQWYEVCPEDGAVRTETRRKELVKKYKLNCIIYIYLAY